MRARPSTSPGFCFPLLGSRLHHLAAWFQLPTSPFFTIPRLPPSAFDTRLCSFLLNGPLGHQAFFFRRWGFLFRVFFFGGGVFSGQ